MGPGLKAEVGFPALCVEAQAGWGGCRRHEASAFTLMISPHCSWLAGTVTWSLFSVGGYVTVSSAVCVPQSQDPPDH